MDKKKKIIGIITPFLDGHYLGGLLYQINCLTSAKGYKLLVVRTPKDDSSFSLPLGMNHVDVWMVLKNPLNEKLVEYAAKVGKPIIGIGHESKHYPCIQMDNFQGMKSSVEHLIEHGHTEIIFIGNLTNSASNQRFEGYKAALTDHGITYKPELLIEVANYAYEGGYDAAKQIINRKLFERAKAIASCSDFLTLRLIEWLKTEGYSAYESFSVIGYDDIVTAAENSLSSLKIPIEEMAQKAVAMLDDVLNNTLTTQTELTLIKPALQTRRSCGCEFTPPAQQDELLKSKLIVNLENILEINRQFTNNLANGMTENIKNLSWLRTVSTVWGCFGEWRDQNNEILDITQHFSFSKKDISMVGTSSSPEYFPKMEWIPSEWIDRDELVIVLYPLCTLDRDWGILSLIQPIDKSIMYLRANTTSNIYTSFAAAMARMELFEELRRTAERLYIVSDSTNDAIWEWDLQTDTIEWNNRIHKLLTLPLSGKSSKSFFSRVHPDDTRKFHAGLDRSALEQTPFHIEFRLDQVAGVYIWVETVGKVLKDQSGSVIRMIGSIRDITERKQKEEMITQMAFQDSLTGIPNRAQFNRHMQWLHEQAVTYNRSYAVMILDLDSFKSINDNYGHDAGDALLQFVANQLQQALREDDMVARVGGDEFYIIVPDIKDVDQDLIPLCDTIMNKLGEPFAHNHHLLKITGSLGVSVYPFDGNTPEELIKNADIAMYRVKNQGKNDFQSFRPVISLGLEGHMKTEQSLRNALVHCEFQLVYQPQVDFNTGKIIGLEALLRWSSPEMGVRTPVDFIPLAERSGLIAPIGDWVLTEVCRQRKLWNDLGLESIPVSLNISGLQLEQGKLVEHVLHVLHETNLSPGCLTLEVNESTINRLSVNCIPTLQRLSDLGIQLAMDEYGADYFSVNMISRIPFNILKMDRLLIQNLGIDESADNTVKALLTVGQQMKFKILAVGVETNQQYQMLREVGCDFYQGYYFAAPLPLDQVIKKYF